MGQFHEHGRGRGMMIRLCQTIRLLYLGRREVEEKGLCYWFFILTTAYGLNLLKEKYMISMPQLEPLLTKSLTFLIIRRLMSYIFTNNFN